MTVRKRKPMHRACSILGVLITLTFAAGAAAKGPIALDICGPTGCVTLDDEHNQQLLFRVLAVPDAPFDSYVSAPPLAPYYKLRFDVDWLESLDFYVPSATVVKSGSNWIQVDPALAYRLEELLRDIAPFPRPELMRALVGGRAVADPSAYAVVFDRLPPAELPLDTERIEIVLRASRPSPWTTRENIGYYAGTGIISRDGEWLALPRSLANTVEADSGVAATASQPPPPEPATLAPVLVVDAGVAPAVGQLALAESPSGDSLPWAAVAGAAGGLLVLLVAAVVARRRAPRRPPARPS